MHEGGDLGLGSGEGAEKREASRMSERASHSSKIRFILSRLQSPCVAKSANFAPAAAVKWE